MQDDIRTDVDFVLTYEELMGIFEAKEINFSTLPDSPDLDEGTRAGRGFAVAGGVAAAVEELIHKEHPDIELKTQRADGLRDCRKLLMLAKAGKLDGYLLEGMACPGGRRWHGRVGGHGSKKAGAAYGTGQRRNGEGQQIPRAGRPTELRG